MDLLSSIFLFLLNRNRNHTHDLQVIYAVCSKLTHICRGNREVRPSSCTLNILKYQPKQILIYWFKEIEKGNNENSQTNSTKNRLKLSQKSSKNARKYIPVWEVLFLSFLPMAFARYSPVGSLKL